MTITITGSSGNDTLFGATAEASVLNALEGNDVLRSQFTTQTLNGAAGNDLIEAQVFNGSTLTLLPGKGNDTISISGMTSSVTLDVGAAGTNNLGNDFFQFNTALGAVQVAGKVYGGLDNDTFNFSDGIGLNNAFVWGNQGADALSLTANETAIFASSKIGLGKGNDSATIAVTTASFNNFTLAGGQGADTFQMSLAGAELSGNNSFLAGGGNDMISATLDGTGINSGRFVLAGNSGADTMTVAFSLANTAADTYSFLLDDQAGTAAFADSLVFALDDTAINVTGTIAGGGGNDTLNLTADVANGSANFYIDAGFGADFVTLEGNAYAGTLAGGGGSDTLQLSLDQLATSTTQSGDLFMTVLGGAGNDTFQNTSFNASAVVVSDFGATALLVTLGDFTTGDIFKLLGNGAVNSDANVNRSAFYTANFTAMAATGSVAGLTGVYENNIALFPDGDDVVLQILAGSDQISGNTAGTNTVGMAVIRFKGNSTFGSNISRASGQLSSLSFAFTQSLNGGSFNFT
jgi:hypothetical protein